MDAWLATAALAAAGGAALAVRSGVAAPAPVLVRAARGEPDHGLLRRGRGLWAALAGCAGWLFLPGAVGGLAAVGLAYAVWTVAARAEPPGVRRRREEARAGFRTSPASWRSRLAGGQAVPAALAQVARALPGPASEVLTGRAPLAIGVPAEEVWAELATCPGSRPSVVRSPRPRERCPGRRGRGPAGRRAGGGGTHGGRGPGARGRHQGSGAARPLSAAGLPAGRHRAGRRGRRSLRCAGRPSGFPPQPAWPLGCAQRGHPPASRRGWPPTSGADGRERRGPPR
jgi:hypothetical protein